MFVKLTDGLGKLQREGGNIDKFFQKINVPSVRAISNISALASNIDVLKFALNTSGVEFDKNTALQDELAARLTTLSAKFTLLGNAAAEAFKSSGAADLVKAATTGLTNLLSDISPEDILEAARILNELTIPLNDIAEASAVSEENILKLQRALVSGALSPNTLKTLISVNGCLLYTSDAADE